MGCHKNYHRRLQNNNHAKGGIEMGGGGNDSVDANVEIGGGVDLTVGLNAEVEVEIDIEADATADVQLGGDVEIEMEAKPKTVWCACFLPKPKNDVEVEVEVEAGGSGGFGLGGGVEIEYEAPVVEVEVGLDAEADFDLDMEFEVACEIDLAVDFAVWGQSSDEQKVNWNGYYVQGGAQNEMFLENLQIDFEGGINGGGDDVCGAFSIVGSLNDDGTFTFEKAYSEYSVMYNGLMEGTALRGMWSLAGQAEEEFEIKLVSSGWTGHFEQGGDQNDMELNMGVSGGCVFGTGNDDVGCFILRGHSDGTEFNFVKKYIGKHQVLYFGESRGDRKKVVKGKWTIPDNCEGTFKLKQG